MICLLVGDSMGMVVLGLESTAQVTIDEILHHTQAVRRGAPHTHIVADLPFMTYQVSDEQAVASAGRLVKKGVRIASSWKAARRWPAGSRRSPGSGSR